MCNHGAGLQPIHEGSASAAPCSCWVSSGSYCHEIAIQYQSCRRGMVHDLAHNPAALTIPLICPGAITTAFPPAAGPATHELVLLLVHVCWNYLCRALGSIAVFFDDHGSGLQCQGTIVSWDDAMNCSIGTFAGSGSDSSEGATRSEQPKCFGNPFPRRSLDKRYLRRRSEN